jgi:tRNA pseudouridine38-40 synthase
MPRYFLELAYMGDRYSGFQVQDNAVTVQSEVEKAFRIFYKKQVELTGSSRTDAGVHALQNYFHFDWEEDFNDRQLYNLNALLPPDIALKSVRQVKPGAHCRFEADSREYKYYIYFAKNPFLNDRAWFYPYTIHTGLLQQAAEIVKQYDHFEAFSKRNTQVKTFQCLITQSSWQQEGNCLVYHVKANRFLRGMVRGLVSTMLNVARGHISLDNFRSIIEKRQQATADFSAPGKGLFLCRVNYPEHIFL